MYKLLFYFFGVGAMMFIGCSKDDPRDKDESYKPDFNVTNFSNPTLFTNEYFPLIAGKTYVYEGTITEGIERTEVKRLNETKTIAGITCVVMNEKTWLNNELIEDTNDWLAQDNIGNIWYMGEYVNNYSKGVVLNHNGSWETNVDGALPGIWLTASRTDGFKYRQEYLFNYAEDEGEIIETNATISIPYGTYTRCLVTHDFTALEPDLNEQKSFAPGIGLIIEYDVVDKVSVYLKEIK